MSGDEGGEKSGGDSSAGERGAACNLCTVSRCCVHAASVCAVAAPPLPLYCCRAYRDRHGSRPTPPHLRGCIGAASAACVLTLTMPLEVVRRRLQAQVRRKQWLAGCCWLPGAMGFDVLLPHHGRTVMSPRPG